MKGRRKGCFCAVFVRTGAVGFPSNSGSFVCCPCALLELLLLWKAPCGWAHARWSQLEWFTDGRSRGKMRAIAKHGPVRKRACFRTGNAYPTFYPIFVLVAQWFHEVTPAPPPFSVSNHSPVAISLVYYVNVAEESNSQTPTRYWYVLCSIRAWYTFSTLTSHYTFDARCEPCYGMGLYF